MNTVPLHPALERDLKLIDLPRGHFSVSAANAWNRCAKAFENRYWLKFPELKGTALILGSAVHGAIEFSDRAQTRTGARLTAEEVGQQAMELVPILIAEAQESGTVEWRKLKESVWDLVPAKTKGKMKKVKIGTKESDETIDDLREDARVLASAYEDQLGPTVDALFAEQEFTLPFEKAGVLLKGYVDLGTKDARIIDRKTGRRREKDHKWEALRSGQLTLYQWAIEELGMAVKGLEIHRGTLTGKGKDRKAAWEPSVTAPRTREQIEDFLSNLEKTVTLAKTGVYPMADDPRTCAMCGFRKICKPHWMLKGEGEEENDATSAETVEGGES